MNIRKRVVETLEQFAATGSQAIDTAIIETGSQQAAIVGISAEDEGPNIALTVADSDRYSVTLLNLEVNYSQLTEAAHDLEHYAEQVTQRLTYLEEPLKLIELDPEANLAQLRSYQPHQEGDVVTYWEVLIWDKPHLRATLARYRWTPGQQEREMLAYPATFALAGRMAEDLAEGLA